MRERINTSIHAIKSISSDKRIRTGLLWNLLATIAGRSSGLVTSVILSRMLGKEVFGEFSIIQNTILTMGIFAGFGTGLTATKHIAETFRTDPERAGRILALTTLLAVVFGCLMAALLVAGAPLITSQFLSSPHLTGLLQLAAISLVASALNGTQNGTLAGFEEFRALSSVTIVTGFANVLAVTLGVIWGGITGAIWGYTLAVVVSCLVGARAVKVACREKRVFSDYRNCMTEWPVLWKFSLPTMLANTLVMPITWICNVMLVNQPGGFGEMATYNIVTQWRQIVLFLPGVVAQVFLPIMTSNAHAQGSQAVKANYLAINLAVALPILLIMSILSPLIMALYGSSYVSQWPVFVIVQLATLAQIIQSPVVTSWAATGRMWINLSANMFWGASLVLFSWFFISKGAFGLGMALLISFLLYFIVIFIVKKIEVSPDVAKC